MKLTLSYLCAALFSLSAHRSIARRQDLRRANWALGVPRGSFSSGRRPLFVCAPARLFLSRLPTCRSRASCRHLPRLLLQCACLSSSVTYCRRRVLRPASRDLPALVWLYFRCLFLVSVNLPSPPHSCRWSTLLYSYFGSLSESRCPHLLRTLVWRDNSRNS